LQKQLIIQLRTYQFHFIMQQLQSIIVYTLISIHEDNKFVKHWKPFMHFYENTVLFMKQGKEKNWN